MVPTMLFAAVLALVYTVLVIRQLRTLRDGGAPANAAGPWHAVWLAARFGRLPESVPADQCLARAESEAAHRLVRGELSRPAYLAAMAELAARDAADHPFDVPTTR